MPFQVTSLYSMIVAVFSLEQNIKQFEPNVLRDALATEIKTTLEQAYNKQRNSLER